MSGLITRVFELIFIVGVPVLILYVAIPAFKRWLGEDKLAVIDNIVAIAVAATEQLGKDKTSEQKFESALSFAKRLAVWRGIEVDEATLTGIIESAVYWLDKGN